MTKIFYEKVGEEYVPVAEYNIELMDSYPKGATLVICNPGFTRRRYSIDPNYAALIAAGTLAEDAICSAISNASQAHIRPRKELTPEQKAAWETLVELLGDDGRTIHYRSAYDIAQAGIEAMKKEAEKLMTNNAVKTAYDNFMLVCKLSQNTKEES